MWPFDTLVLWSHASSKVNSGVPLSRLLPSWEYFFKVYGVTHKLGCCTAKRDDVFGPFVHVCVSFRIIWWFAVPATNEDESNLLFSDVPFLEALTLLYSKLPARWSPIEAPWLCTDLMWHELGILLGSPSSLVVVQTELVSQVRLKSLSENLETKGQTFDQKFTKSTASSQVLANWLLRLSSLKPE